MLKILYAQAFPALLIDLVALDCLVLLLIYAGAPSMILLSWGTSIIMATLARYMLARRFLERFDEERHANLWRAGYVATAVPYGILWGLAGLFFITPDAAASLIVVIFMLCGLAAGALVVYAASIVTFWLFIVALFAPFTFKMLAVGSEPSMIALVVSLGWAGFVGLVGWRSYNQLKLAVTHQVWSLKLADELAQARDEAEFKSAAKSTFVARMNHELRTPLNAIIGFTDMMRNQTFGPIGDPKYEEYIESVHASGTHLNDLISDLLDLSQIEAGTFVLRDEAVVNLRSLISDCLDIVANRARLKGVRLSSGRVNKTLNVKVDPTRFRQVLLNILINAIKYSDRGGTVDIKVAFTQSGGLALQVIDQGCGMETHEVETAIAPFIQLDQIDETARQGIGLGLSIAKSLIEAHDGMLVINSRPGEGTTVSIQLPKGRLIGSAPVAHAIPTARTAAAPGALAT